MDKPEYRTTFTGLQKWYETVFDELGRTVLAEAQGNHALIKDYKESLFQLLDHLRDKIRVIQDPDKKEDLIILHNNLIVIIEFVNRSFAETIPETRNLQQIPDEELRPNGKKTNNEPQVSMGAPRVSPPPPRIGIRSFKDSSQPTRQL